jgi:hypothetical protein
VRGDDERAGPSGLRAMTGEARRTVLIAAAVVLAALAVAWGAGWLGAVGRTLEERQDGAVREAIVAESFAPVLEEPALQARAAGASEAEQQALLFELARDGLVRLPDDVLLERLLLLRDVAVNGDERTCALVLVGGTPAAAGDVLASLDEPTLRRWLLLSRDAVLATLRDDPPRPLAPAEVARAGDALLAALGPEDARRFETARRSLAGLSQGDACQLARATLTAASELPPEDRLLVARMFAGG